MKTRELITIGVVLIVLILFFLGKPINRDRIPIPTFDNLGTNAVPVLVEFLTTNQSHAQQNTTHNVHFSFRTFVAQRNAMRALGYMGTNAEVAVPILMEYLKDGDSRNQGPAAEALAIVGRNQKDIVIPALMQTLTKLPNSTDYARVSVANALASFGKDARSALPFLLWASQNQDARLATAVKVIAPETPNALAPLIECLKSIEPGVRQQTIYALGGLGTNGAEATPALLKCLSHPDFTTRCDATRALNQIGLDSNEFVVGLSNNLFDANYFVSHESLETLGGLAVRSKSAFVVLVKEVVNFSVNRDYRDGAKYRLLDAARKDPKYLLECLADSDAGTRRGALIVFSELGRSVPASVPKLKKLATNDPDPDIRSRAADVLRFQQQ